MLQALLNKSWKQHAWFIKQRNSSYFVILFQSLYSLFHHNRYLKQANKDFIKVHILNEYQIRLLLLFLVWPYTENDLNIKISSTFLWKGTWSTARDRLQNYRKILVMIKNLPWAIGNRFVGSVFDTPNLEAVLILIWVMHKQYKSYFPILVLCLL